MSKVTISKDGKIGVLTRGTDGKWSIAMDGKAAPGNYYYTDEQVDRMVQTARSAGSAVTVE